MDKHFEVLVIGGGSAGTTIALKCAASGLKTAIVDYRPLGGTCALRGCDPKKILADTSAFLDLRKRLPSVIKTNPEIKWEDIVKFKKTFTDPVPAKRQKSFQDAGVAILEGAAVFDSANSVLINKARYTSDKIVITTGSRPRKLNIEGEDHLTYSEHFFELESMPSEIIFIGGGFISFEFAFIANSLGSKVKIIHNDNFPLEMYDRDVVLMLLDISRKKGIEIILDSPVDKIVKKGSRFIVRAKDKQFDADMVMHGAGRIADVEGLNLKSANIEYKNGIIVNEYMQSVSNERIYAAGDSSAGSPPLTPIAVFESKIVADNIINRNKSKRDFNIIPSTLFTNPALGGVGLTEDSAIKKNIDFRKKFADTGNWYHLKKSGYRGTGFKVLVDNRTNLIIGAFIISPNAEDIINLITMAMHTSLDVKKIKEIMFTYPSITSDIKYMI